MLINPTKKKLQLHDGEARSIDAISTGCSAGSERETFIHPDDGLI